MPDQIIEQAAKRYQCRHIFTDGRRCGSPCCAAKSSATTTTPHVPRR